MPADPDDWRRTGQEKYLTGATFESRSFKQPSQEGLRAWRSKSTGAVAEGFSDRPPTDADDWEEIDPAHEWDHEHCKFCWAKFVLEGASDDPLDLTVGYVAEGKHWVCAQCFTDFRDEFGWTVRENS